MPPSSASCCYAGPSCCCTVPSSFCCFPAAAGASTCLSRSRNIACCCLPAAQNFGCGGSRLCNSCKGRLLRLTARLPCASRCRLSVSSFAFCASGDVRPCKLIHFTYAKMHVYIPTVMCERGETQKELAVSRIRQNRMTNCGAQLEYVDRGWLF